MYSHLSLSHNYLNWHFDITKGNYNSESLLKLLNERLIIFPGYYQYILSLFLKENTKS
jgi:hypothetical protein